MNTEYFRMKPNQTSIILASVEPPFVVVVLVALVCDGSDGIVAALILVTAVGFVVILVMPFIIEAGTVSSFVARCCCYNSDALTLIHVCVWDCFGAVYEPTQLVVVVLIPVCVLVVLEQLLS